METWKSREFVLSKKKKRHNVISAESNIRNNQDQEYSMKILEHTYNTMLNGRTTKCIAN